MKHLVQGRRMASWDDAGNCHLVQDGSDGAGIPHVSREYICATAREAERRAREWVAADELAMYRRMAYLTPTASVPTA